jgi:hypothetical protein
MKNKRFPHAIYIIFLLLTTINTAYSATLSIDLDTAAPGIQDTTTILPGSVRSASIVFTGDNTYQFDTFAFNVLINQPHFYNPVVSINNPTAGEMANRAPLMALDIFNASQIAPGQLLAEGNMPLPLGYDSGLGGVGISSVGGLPFTLTEQNESIDLLTFELAGGHVGSSDLELSGYPYWTGVELSLAGEPVPVSLQSASVTVVPIPTTVWLFLSGILLFIIVYNIFLRNDYHTDKRVLGAVISSLTLGPHVCMAIPDSSADVDRNALVTSLDISRIASCFGHDPSGITACASSDVNNDGSVDIVDFNFVSMRMGQAYPYRIYPIPEYKLSLSDDLIGVIKTGYLNGGGYADLVITDLYGNFRTLLGTSDLWFRRGWRYSADSDGDYFFDVELLDMNNDQVLDVILESEYNICVAIGNGNGGFQDDQCYSAPLTAGPFDVADINSDDILDIVVGSPVHRYRCWHTFLLGAESGEFSSIQNSELCDIYSEGSASLNLEDIDSDGTPDLISTRYNNIWVNFGNGDASFRSPQLLLEGVNPLFEDVNDDGNLDILYTNNGISLVLGNGDGSYGDPRQVFDDENVGTFSDFDGDHILDYIVATDDSYTLLKGVGNANYQVSHTITGAGTLRSFGDINNDGYTDGIFENTESDDFFSYISVVSGAEDKYQKPQNIIVGDQPASVDLSDLNGDGKLDIVVANRGSDDISILLGRDKGEFEEGQHITVNREPMSIATGDFNQDGVEDIVVANYGSDDITILIGDGHGGFLTHQNITTGEGPVVVETGNIDDNEKQDIMVVSQTSNNISILLGNGSGNFELSTTLEVDGDLVTAALSDLNEDDILDVVVSREGSEVTVFYGNGNGSFQDDLSPFPSSRSISSLAIGDINKDGKPDLVGCNTQIGIWLSGDNDVYDTRLSLGQGKLGWFNIESVDLKDLNGDGTLDIIVSNAQGSSVSIFLGFNDGSFSEEQRFVVGSGPGKMEFGDLNNDGRLDMIVTHENSDNITILLNQL